MAYLPTTDNSPSTQTITAQDIGSTTSTTNANNQSVRSGSPTTNSVATFALGSWETVTVEVTGTWTGSLLIEGSIDGTLYYQKAVKQIGISYIANNFTANFAGTVNVATLTQLAVRATTAWTGTATVTVRQSANNNGIYVHNGLNIQDAVIATNKLTVKSASTPAATTDPAVVVALSPNTPITGGLPTINGELGDVTGTFTNATQTTSVTATNLNGYGNTLISINGTYGGATAVFEGSDDGGITWYGVQAARDNSAVIENGYTLLTNISQTWQINNPGMDSIRVRSTAVASGTVNVRLSSSAAPVASGTIVGIGAGNVGISDGTNAVNVLKSDGTAAGQNAELIAGTGMTTGTLTLNLGSPNTVWYDLLNYPGISLEILTNSSAATMTFQTSGDASQTNPRSMQLFESQGLSSNGVLNSVGTNNTYSGPRTGRYFRISSNVSGANTITLVLTFYTTPGVTAVNGGAVSAAQSGTWTVGSNSATGSAVPANAFYVGMAGTSANLTGLQSATNTGASASSLGQELATAGYVYNGSTGDMMRSATAASNTTGTGLLGVGNLIFDGTNWQAQRATITDSNNGSGVATASQISWNGTTYDRNRNNTIAAVQAAGTTATSSNTITTYNARQAVIIINVSAYTSGTMNIAINLLTSSGYSYSPFTSITGLAATGTVVYRIGPGLTAVAGLTANDMLGRSLQVVVSGTFSATYGIDINLGV